MTGIFLKIYDALSKRRSIVFIVACIVMLLCVFLALRMDYDEDIAAFMPVDGQSEKYSEVFGSIGGQNRIAVLFRGDDFHSLEKAMDAFGEAVLRRDTAKMARNLQIRMDESSMMEMIGGIGQVYPFLMGERDYCRMDSILSSGNLIRAMMEQNKFLLMFPVGGTVSASVSSDPLNVSAGIMSRLRGLNVSDGYDVIDGFLFKDSTGIVLLESPFGISESRNNRHLQQLLDSCMEETVSEFPDVSVSAVGAPIVAVTNATQIKKDSMLAVCLAIVLILSVLLYSFRRPSDLAWIGVSVFAGWLFALGAIALINDGISIIVIGIGSVIIGIAVNYPLHFIEHLKYETDMRETLKEMVPPLLVGNITTVSAFLCLVLLDARAMRDLGLFGSLTLVGTILFVLVCLPVLLNGRKSSPYKERSLNFGKLSLPDNRHARRAALWIIAGLTMVFGYFSTGTSFDSDMRNINYMLDSQREDMEFLSSGIAGGDHAVLYAVAEGRNVEEALRVNEKMTEIIGGMDGIDKITGIAGLMPSDSLCAERAGMWHSFWKDRGGAMAVLESEAAEAGFSVTAFSPFEKMAFGQIDTVAMQGFKESFYGLIGKNFILDDGNICKVVNFVNADKGRIEAIKDEIRAVVPEGCFVFSQEDVSSHLAQLLSESFDYIGFVCGFVVFAFLWLSLGSIELSIIAFLPLAVGWIWILGIMDILGMQFNIVNIILATFIFGQGDDYTIFIIEGLMYEYTTGKKRLERYKNSVALSAVIMFIGIGTLIFSRHPAMRSLAEVAIIGMITVVFMAYFIPPVAFRWLTEKNGRRREYPVTLSRLAASLFSISFFIIGMFGFMIPYTLLIYRPLQKIWNGEGSYHRLLQRVSAFVIRHVPGVRYKEIRRQEDFSRPAVIICNHQSHLDLMCLMQLSPKIIVLTNDWVWNNPYYGAVIHTAEFRPVSNGYDRNFPYLQDLVRRGYSIAVFPEGTRTPDGEIGRFHKGAFMLAKALGIDIVPLVIHGLYDVLPKHDFMLRKGSVTLEACERIPYDSFKDIPERDLARNMRGWYVSKYAEMRKELETAEYEAPYKAYLNKYKIKTL